MTMESEIGSGPPTRQITFDLKINVVSLLNLVALIGLLFTAMGTWYGLVGEVKTTNLRIDNATSELARIRSDVKATLDQRDADIRNLRDKVDAISTKTIIIDQQLSGAVDSLKRVEAVLDRVQKHQP